MFQNPSLIPQIMSRYQSKETRLIPQPMFRPRLLHHLCNIVTVNKTLYCKEDISYNHGIFLDTPLSLQSLCRLVVRRSLGEEANKKIPLLGNIGHNSDMVCAHVLTSGLTRGRLQDLLRHKYVDPGHFDPDTRDQVESRDHTE